MMTRFLLDISFIIVVLNNRKRRHEMMRELIAPQHELGCCPINITEVYNGIRGPEGAVTEALLKSLELIPVSFDAARLGGELRQSWSRQGKTFSVPDMIIAAVCINDYLTIITIERISSRNSNFNP